MLISITHATHEHMHYMILYIVGLLYIDDELLYV